MALLGTMRLRTFGGGGASRMIQDCVDGGAAGCVALGCVVGALVPLTESTAKHVAAPSVSVTTSITIPCHARMFAFLGTHSRHSFA